MKSKNLFHDVKLKPLDIKLNPIRVNLEPMDITLDTIQVNLDNTLFEQIGLELKERGLNG